jgi:hypothetical protein
MHAELFEAEGVNRGKPVRYCRHFFGTGTNPAEEFMHQLVMFWNILPMPNRVISAAVAIPSTASKFAASPAGFLLLNLPRPLSCLAGAVLRRCLLAASIHGQPARQISFSLKLRQPQSLWPLPTGCVPV